MDQHGGGDENVVGGGAGTRKNMIASVVTGTLLLLHLTNYH